MSKKVLVVDDSQVDRDKLSGVLQKSGYQVTTAVNGAQALDVVKVSKPEVIFMDVNMPEMDGFAATRALKADAETKSIPVVLVTSKDQKADKAWGQMLGASGYVTKPYTDQDVLDVVRTI